MWDDPTHGPARESLIGWRSSGLISTRRWQLAEDQRGQTRAERRIDEFRGHPQDSLLLFGETNTEHSCRHGENISNQRAFNRVENNELLVERSDGAGHGSGGAGRSPST